MNCKSDKQIFKKFEVIFINGNYNLNKNDSKCRVPKEIFKLSEQLFEKYEFCKDYKKNVDYLKTRYQKVNILFMINLYNSYFKQALLACPTNYTYYKEQIINTQETKKIFTKTLIKNHINNLLSYELINIRKGFYNQNNKTNNFITRIWPTQKLIDEFSEFNINYTIDPDYIELYSDDLLIVRGYHKKNGCGNKVKGKLIKYIPEIYKGDKEKEKIAINTLKILKPKIQRYNDEIQKRFFNMDYNEELIENYPDFIEKKLIKLTYHSGTILSPNMFKITRIFNDCSLKSGGRMYSIFQYFNKEFRKKLFIDNKSVKLVDLSGCHMRMLYHLKGIDIEKDDLYDVFKSNNKKLNKVLRNITKKAILIIINSKSLIKNIYTLKKIIIDEFQKEFEEEISKAIIEEKGLLKKEFIKKYFSKIINQFSEVNEYFFQDIGKNLQFIESQIIFESMIELLNEYDIIALPVHDELVVNYNSVDTVKKIIINNYKKIKLLNGYSPKLTVK